MATTKMNGVPFRQYSGFSVGFGEKSVLQNMFDEQCIIKNASSSTSHKKTPSLRLSLREIKKILPNTFIYESILIKKNYEYQ
jgi:hypothetical protein